MEGKKRQAAENQSVSRRKRKSVCVLGGVGGVKGVSRLRCGIWKSLFQLIWFHRVTKKYVEHLESGTARRGQRGAAGEDGRGGGS